MSVRSASEAAAALRGGAALIDVKEPAHGALGRAHDAVIADVVREVAGQSPVSAALGELMAPMGPASRRSIVPRQTPLAYVKWGLADSASGWQRQLRDAMQHLTEQLPSCRAVAVAYADWRRARSPTPENVCAFAATHPVGAFLIDTWQKDGSTLLDWLSIGEIEHLRARCRVAGVPMALAGSLGPAEIRTLLPLQPDWFAVRGAVCQGQQRGGVIDEGEVRQLVEMIHPATSVS